MAEPIRILLAFVLAAAPSALLCRVMMSVRIMDAPTEARKIQRRAVPTSGGLAVTISAFLATVAITEFTEWDLDSIILVTGSGALCAMLLGLADDILHIRATFRLLLVMAITIAMAVFGARVETLVLWPGVVIQLPYVLAKPMAIPMFVKPAKIVKGLSARTLRALYNARGLMDGKFRNDPVNQATFRQIMMQHDGITHAMRLMNQTSVLGRYLWVFRRIVGQMQHDLFHVYTVDQHILMVLRNMRRFFIPEHALGVAPKEQIHLLVSPSLGEPIAQAESGFAVVLVVVGDALKKFPGLVGLSAVAQFAVVGIGDDRGGGVGHVTVTAVLVGDGPERSGAERYVRERGLQQAITFAWPLSSVLVLVAFGVSYRRHRAELQRAVLHMRGAALRVTHGDAWALWSPWLAVRIAGEAMNVVNLMSPGREP